MRQALLPPCHQHVRPQQPLPRCVGAPSTSSAMASGSCILRPGLSRPDQSRGKATRRCLVVAAACPYQVLGLRPLSASEDDIKQAYRQKARETHPDCTGDAQSAVQFLEVQKAYALLMDPAKRAKYDARLRPRSRTVLSYLNARAAVRSGFQNSSPGVVDEDMREELYSTMRDLLRQARRMVRQVEKELNKGERLRSAPARTQPAPSPVPLEQRAQPVPVHLIDCVEGEPCEPWLYYAAAAARRAEARGK